MSLFFKWGGIALVMIGAMLVSREYESYLDRRICEYRGLVAMISHAESEIGKSSTYKGFDFSSVWEIVDGYPYIRNNPFQRTSYNK